MLFQAMGTPRAHPKSKPFVDRVMSFVWLDNRVWVRNFQVSWSADAREPDDHELIEVGPRFVLNPIRIFAGAFGGPTLYENEHFESPNDVRRRRKAAAGQKFRDRMLEKATTAQKKANITFARDPVEAVFHDAEEAAQ